jgi:hypothetical protein
MLLTSRHHARYSGKIAQRSDVDKSSVVKECAHRIRLVMTVLDHEPTARRQAFARADNFTGRGYRPSATPFAHVVSPMGKTLSTVGNRMNASGSSGNTIGFLGFLVPLGGITASNERGSEYPPARAHDQTTNERGLTLLLRTGGDRL